MISLCNINWQEDMDFLFQVYANSRSREMKLVPWNEKEKETFLSQQFQTQHQYYQKIYPHSFYQIIKKDNVSVGRLYSHIDDHEYRVIDISILAEHRGKGIGTEILQNILSKADHLKIPVTIFVERTNPARRLYERLGFVESESEVSKEIYMFMKRSIVGKN